MASQEKSATARPPAAKPKRPKTGGRKPKKTLQQQLEEGEASSQIAGWHNDVLISSDLAAVYLRCSVDDLEEMRVPKDPDSDRGSEGPLMGKNIKKGAESQNQPVNYRLGALKQWWREREGRTSHEVAINNNLLGWVSAHEPFFAQPLTGKRHERNILVAMSWDDAEPCRDEFFGKAAREELRVIWLSPAEAAASQWAQASKHRAFAQPWLALLASERQRVEAAIDRTDISESAEGRAGPVTSTNE